MAGTKQIDPRARRFFEAAEPLLERFGYRKTTVEDVCRAAGMSKRTFYELFSDKNDLLLQWMETMINDMTESWEASLPPDLDPLSRLYSFLDLYVRMVREHPAMRVAVEDIELMRMFGAQLDQIRLAQLGGPVDRILKDGMAVGQFRQLDPKAAMWVVFGLLDTVYLLTPHIMGAPGPLEDPHLAEETRQFIVRGLGALGAGSDDPKVARGEAGG